VRLKHRTSVSLLVKRKKTKKPGAGVAGKKGRGALLIEAREGKKKERPRKRSALKERISALGGGRSGISPGRKGFQ